MLAPTWTKGPVVLWFLVSFRHLRVKPNALSFRRHRTLAASAGLSGRALREAFLMVLICLSSLSDVTPMTTGSKTTPMP